MYVELHATSAFSFLEAAGLPEALAEEAARLGLTALVGAEVTLSDGGRLPLLVDDREGYRNLCRLLTRIKMRAPKGEGMAGWGDLEEHAGGLGRLTGGVGGTVARA